MDYVINPIWFYVISTAEGLKILSIVIALSLGLAAIIAISYGCAEDDDNCKKLGKKMTILFIISTSIVILIPSKEATYQMMIASLATKGNIEEVVQAILDAAKQFTGK